MLEFETRGTPFERGRQQGEICRELAGPWMKHVMQEMIDRLGETSSLEVVRRVQDDVDRWLRQMDAVYPEGNQECRGIASGLGMDERTYFTVAFSSRLLGKLCQCTTLGFRDSRGRLIMGKTDDILQHELGMNVLETTRPDTGYRHVHFHFAGSIWTVAGMNERGLAIAMNGIPGPALDEEGLFSLVALHTILPACATVPEAVEHLRDLRVNFYGFSLLIGDADGGLSIAEKTGAGTVVLPEQPGGFLLHTNHILDPEFAEENPPQSEPVLTNGQRRYENGLRLLRSLPRSEEGMEMFLSDRAPNGAICQQGEDGLHTDFGVIFVPTEKRVVFWPGYPGTVEARSLALSEMF